MTVQQLIKNTDENEVNSMIKLQSDLAKQAIKWNQKRYFIQKSF